MLAHHPTAVERLEEARYLTEMVARIAPRGDPVTDFSIRDGIPPEALVEGIREAAGELVVMATRARGSIGPLAIASIADSLIRTSPAPLLLLQPRGDDPEAPVPVHALLAPVDIDRDPGSMIPTLTDFACLTQTHVTLLNIVALTALRAAAQKRLDGIADGLRARGIRAAARVIVGSDIGAAIAGELARGPADLLAVAPRRAGATGWNPEDGVTETLLRSVTKPVLILPSAAATRPFATGAPG